LPRQGGERAGACCAGSTRAVRAARGRRGPPRRGRPPGRRRPGRRRHRGRRPLRRVEPRSRAGRSPDRRVRAVRRRGRGLTMAGRTLTFVQALNEAMRQAMEQDSTVVVMGEDVAGGGGREDQGIQDAWGGILGATRGLIGRFGPERVIDTPISEMGFMGMAVGAAATGLRPVVELMFMDFIGSCLDMLLNQAAKLRYMFGGTARVPMVVRTLIGAGFRAAAQHSQSLHGFTVAIPGLKTV